MRIYLAAAAVLASAAVMPAQAKTLCTLVADAGNGKVLKQEGDCATRVTPASTFKIPLAVIGFDQAFLKTPHEPVLTFKKGDPDWGGADWKRPTDPERWLKYSVVWYSQRITHALGERTLTDYARSFGYGNADFSGDAGKNNGLDRAWIASSLKISPQEQIGFLTKLAKRALPVKPEAMEQALASMETLPIAAPGWQVRGKTGMAYPRSATGTFDYGRPWGWFVGVAEQGDRKVVFAQLIQDEKKQADSPSARARTAILNDLSALLRDAGTP
jgi:beta-lactamase class D